MRKNVAYLAILAIMTLLPGCTKTEITSGCIAFAPVAAKATRAIIQDTTYPEGESFLVSAYHNGTSAYFEGLTATYWSTVNGTKLWETSTTEYWPLEGSLDFIAYSPASINTTQASERVIIDSEDGVVAEGYTVQNTTQMTTDFCYATATVADCASHPESVPLAFSHALSQVVFRVKAADYYNDGQKTVSMTLKSLSLGGINSVGSFAAGTWSDQSTEYSYPLFGAPSAPIALTYGEGNVPDVIDVCAFLYIPQTLGANAAITVGYSIEQTVNSSTFTFENAPVSIKLGGAGSAVTQWQPGKKYIYTLSIGLNNLITFTVTADGWTDKEAGVVVE